MTPLDSLTRRAQIAYFSMEIALRPEVHTYSGGLGGLAGDTARSSADLELPVVFVTLASRSGYMRQEIDAEGRQIEQPSPWSPEQWTRPLGAKVAITLEGRDVWIRPWLFLVTGVTGYQTPVILLDTALLENAPEDRTITDRLYGGDKRYRLKQEAVLGIGGVRALRALGFDINRYHMNEGHSALLVTELLKRFGTSANGNDGNSSWDVVQVRDRCIFTTHTPVAAGHDRFSYDLVEAELGASVDMQTLRRFGGHDELNMTHLALNLSGYVNGVAKRHADTSRKMFPGHAVRAVTNGVHPATWTASSFTHLYDRHFPDWRHDPEVLLRAHVVPGAEVRAAHEEAKRALLARVRAASGVMMNPDVPLIGFARRMTAYKRANLLFHDIERLRAINRHRPFQVVLAGKAHPHDEDGKRIIQQIHRHIRDLEGELPIAFLPNYDMELARTLISGSDVWLNTPVPPLEASGTSGMKAALNGVLNFSVLDGWWSEGCVEGETGWAIGDGSDGTTAEHDAPILYDKLENTVLSLYYDDPERWLWMMSQAISRIGSYFNTHRMMRRYASEAYLR